MKSHKLKQHSLEKVVAKALKNAGVSKILATVSGGADSVALLAALSSLPWVTVVAAHCNFHLRGEESQRDALFVENLCRQLSVPLLVKDFDVASYRLQHPGTSIEMACRELRYAWFRSLLTTPLQRIATGHNADDNAETLLLNLLRGSGTTGLRGMLPDSNDILRPLLTVHRSEILDYLRERNLTYVTDSSNLSSDYRRNFLRNDILPLLRSRWPGADKALDRSLELLRAENALVESALAAALPAPSSPAAPNSPTISRSPLTTQAILSFPAPELLIRRYILPLSPRTTTAAEILAAVKAAKSDVRRWQLPGGTVELRGSLLRLLPTP